LEYLFSVGSATVSSTEFGDEGNQWLVCARPDPRTPRDL
jgi:hypothetical protein